MILQIIMKKTREVFASKIKPPEKNETVKINKKSILNFLNEISFKYKLNKFTK